MAQEGPAFAGSASNYDDGGDQAWADPANAVGDTTGTGATCTPPASGNSQQLRCTNFGLAVPGGATITGVTVEVEAVATGTPRHFWSSVKLLVAGSEAGSDLADLSYVPTTKTFKTFGGGSELWGLSLSDSDTAGSGFGVCLKIARDSTNATTSVSRVRITVDYAAGTTPSTASATWVFSGSAALTGVGALEAHGSMAFGATARFPQAPGSAGFFLTMCKPPG